MADRTHRPGRRRARADAAPTSSVRPPDGPAEEHWQQLQRTAGNAAVGAVLQVQRDEPAGGSSLLSMRPPPRAGTGPSSLVPRLSPEDLAKVLAEADAATKAKQDEVRPKVVAWLEQQRAQITEQSGQGTISMPELVARIRDEVEGAKDVQAFWLEQLAKQRLGILAPPPTRRKVTQSGVLSEISAIISNLTSAQVKVGTDAAGLTVGITGVVTGKVKAGPVEASVEADPKKKSIEGVTGKAKVGPVGVSATHKSVGLDIEFPFIAGSTGKLKGSVGKDGDWKVGISLPLAGSKPISAHPTAEAIGKSVREAEEAAREIVSLLNQGEEPDADALGKLASKVGSALKNIEKVTKPERSKGPQLTLDVGVERGQRELPGAGDPVKIPELKGGLTITLRF